MKYVLIDTCILKSSLIGKSDYSNDLIQLKYWIETEQIKFCSPEPLIEEWTKHKAIEEQLIEKQLKAKTRDLKLSRLYDISVVESGEDKARMVLLNQVNDLDKIINNGVKVETTENVSHIIIKHQTQGLPPFHKKKNSLNDAILIFSFLNFADSNNFSEIYFVSSNHSDFGDEVYPEQKINFEIQKHFPNLNIRYYTTSKVFIDELIASGLPRIKNENIDSQISYFPKVLFPVYNQKHRLLQLEELVKILYNELNFVPLHILIQQYPLRDKYNSRYNSFELTTYNNEIKTLFDSVEIRSQKNIKIIDNEFFSGIKQPELVLSNVLKKFTSNLIYYIDTSNNNDKIDARFFDSEICNCARCQIENFSFETLDFTIEVKDSKLENLLNNAYGHYRMGHFKKTYQIYKEALSLAKEEKKQLSEYIINYNLSHLASLIESNYYSDEESQLIAKELREIDLSDSHCLSKDDFHKEIQVWMLNDYYMKHFHSKISELKQQLIDHYYNSINNGIGTNNFVNDLINQYAQLHQFLQLNTIINDCYKTYHDIVEMVIEGLFASYAVEGDRSSRIDSFNDWLLSQILKYGRTRSIRKLVNRYKIKELHYESPKSDHESITDQIIKLFDQSEIVREKLSSIDEPNYDYFRNEYTKWLNNGLYIASLVDFEREYIVRFTDSFLNFYYRNTHRLDTIEIVAFLVRKFHYFTDKQRKELFLMGIREEQLLNSYFLHNLASLCEDEQITFKLSKEEFDSIIQKSFIQTNNFISLIHVYRCLSNSDQKEVVQLRILKVLKDSFSIDLWNLAILHDIVPFNDDDLKRAITMLTPKKNIIGQPLNFFNGSRNNSALDQLINICFHLNIDLTESRFDRLRDNSSYYKWLFDIDGFDYKNFEPSWLMEYGTKQYLKRFSESLVLKNNLLSLLRDPKVKNKMGLREAYLDIFMF